MLENYGENSCFYKAYKILASFEVDQISILNLQTWEHVENQKELLRDLGFDYILPLNLYPDDYYNDPQYFNAKIYYSQLLLRCVHPTISTIIMTGKHASGFENLTAFLEDERTRVKKMQARIVNLKKENMIYVANNLAGYEYANVVLAAALIKTDYNEYPKLNLIGSVVFDIDYPDLKDTRIAYFKSNFLTGITIENLVNFSEHITLRLVPVYKIIKYFYYYKPNHEQFIGKAFTDYRKVKIREVLEEFLQNLIGYIIYKYQINSVTDISTEVGSVDVILRYDIWPKFTTEKYTVETTL